MRLSLLFQTLKFLGVMMNKQTQEALKMAIEQLEAEVFPPLNKAFIIAKLKEALEQPAQEPVAHFVFSGNVWSQVADEYKNEHFAVPLYTHPHQWQGLTDEHLLGQLFGIRFQRHTENLMSNPPQIKYSYTIQESDLIKFARAIEQALKEKNHG